MSKKNTRHHDKKEIEEQNTFETAGQTKTTVSQQKDTESEKADIMTENSVKGGKEAGRSRVNRIRLQMLWSKQKEADRTHPS